MNDQKANSREGYIDVVKGIGILLVLLGHSEIEGLPFKFIYSFHMPIFFIFAGYLYNAEKWNKLGLWMLIKKKWKAYIIPYFALGFVNLLLNIPAEYYKGIRGEKLFNSTLKHIYYIAISQGGGLSKCPIARLYGF